MGLSQLWSDAAGGLERWRLRGLNAGQMKNREASRN